MENIDFELYKVFYYVAKNKNLTKAASELFISQPAVTQAIKKLEEEMGVKLFFRTKSGMNLTSDGEVLFNYLERPIECLNNGKRHLIDEKKDDITIRIGSSTTLIKYNLLPVLKIFKEKYPNVKFEITQGISSNLVDMLDNDLLDIVILSINHKNKKDNRVVIIEEVQDVFCYKKDSFNIKEKLSMEELNNYPLLLQSDVSTSRKFLNELAMKEHIILKSNYEIASYSLVLDFLKEGLGIGFVNYKHVKEEIENNSLVIVKTNFEIPKRQIGLFLNKKKTDDAVIKLLVNYLRGY